MSKFNFGQINQVASGAGSVNQIGENQANTNVGDKGDSLTIEQVFTAIAAAVETPAPPTDQPSSPATEPTPDAPVQVAPVTEDTVAPLQTLACMPLASQETPDIKAKASNLIERLVPYAPQIGKALAVFGEAALTSLAIRNPVVAGVVAVCQMTKGNDVA